MFVMVVILIFCLVMNRKPNKVKISSSIIKNIPCIKLIEKDSYFELYSNCEDTFGDYFYRIYDKNNEIIDEQYVKKGTTINRINNIIEVRMNYGTLAVISKYYNINVGVESEYFQNVLLSNDKLCVYLKNDKIIIQDLFDKNLYFKVIDEIELDMINSMENLEFVENNTYLKINYSCNNKLDCKTIMISLK